MAPITKLKLLRILKTTGLFWLARRTSKKAFRILMYHRFSKHAEAGKIAQNQFERQMIYLKNNYTVVNLDTVLRKIHLEGCLANNTAVITVDDGYQDFFSFALPILYKYSLPATVFLTTDFVDHRIWLWHDIVNYAFQNTTELSLSLKHGTEPLHLDLSWKDAKIKAKEKLFQILTSISNQKKYFLIDEIVRKLDVNLPDRLPYEYHPLTWSQIKDMAGHGITFGAHTCTHPVLSRVDDRTAAAEIFRSKHRIEDVLENTVVSFCYPNGRHGDFTKVTKDILRKAGFLGAVTAVYGLNFLGTDRYELKRLSVDSRRSIFFQKDLSGLGWFQSASFPFLGRKVIPNAVRQKCVES